jgi:hypothetical protein
LTDARHRPRSRILSSIWNETFKLKHNCFLVRYLFIFKVAFLKLTGIKFRPDRRLRLITSRPRCGRSPALAFAVQEGLGLSVQLQPRLNRKLHKLLGLCTWRHLDDPPAFLLVPICGKCTNPFLLPPQIFSALAFLPSDPARIYLQQQIQRSRLALHSIFGRPHGDARLVAPRQPDRGYCATTRATAVAIGGVVRGVVRVVVWGWNG